ncbi:MAG: polysaccharide deacetylase family protein [Bacteroidales bacterium]|jgi:hypothetical protein
MLIFYTDQITNRIKYTFDFIFTEILLIPHQLMDNKEDFLQSEGYKIIYSQTSFSEMPFIYRHDIMISNDIDEVHFEEDKINDIPVIFSYNREDSFLNFDVFSAVFYMISRYEEYLIHTKDIHGRYDYSNSIAYKLGVLDVPIVHIWANLLKDKLLKMYPDIEFEERKYQFLPTIDVDLAYKHIYKGFLRTTGGIFKSLFKQDFKQAHEKILCIFKLKKDPYDTFDNILELKKEYNINMIFFFLLANEGKFDKSNDPNNNFFQQLIRKIYDYAEIGIHFSYNSVENINLMESEKLLLQEIIHSNVIFSRQHFLRFNLPLTYQNLYDNDIRNDFSMGYASITGFRAGVCIPFKFFDLEANAQTNLVLYPISVMDGTLFQYMHLSYPEAIEEIKRIVEVIRKHNGLFIPLLHNSSLSDEGIWKGKSNLLEDIIKIGL